jgi:glyoxylase-like metal-dependent hydrolase (beta-lactamase superfamily II)
MPRLWDEPGAAAVVDGVHLIALPLPEDGLRAVNVYLLEWPDGLTLVDGGWALAESLQVLEASLRQLGYSLGDLRNILVTHIHRDHYSQAVWLRDRYGVRVGRGADERPGLEELLTIRTNVPVESIARLRAGGADDLIAELEAADWPAFDPSAWDLPDVWLYDGDRMAGLDAMATPGHTRGHLVFRDPDRSLLFSGDHILPHITPSIGFELCGAALPLKDYLASLDRVLALPDGPMLPAHGPVSASFHDRGLELLDHHARRFEACLDVHVSGATALDVACTVPKPNAWRLSSSSLRMVMLRGSTR